MIVTKLKCVLVITVRFRSLFAHKASSLESFWSYPHSSSARLALSSAQLSLRRLDGNYLALLAEVRGRVPRATCLDSAPCCGNAQAMAWELESNFINRS